MLRQRILIALVLGSFFVGSLAVVPAAQAETAVAQWTGTGNQTTETFTVTSPQWRLRWEGTSGPRTLFTVNVWREGEERRVGTAGSRGEIGGESVLRGAGTYYIGVIAANTTWTLTVEELP